LYSTLHIIEVFRNLYSQKTWRKVSFYWRRYLRRNSNKTICVWEWRLLSTGTIQALVTMVMKIQFR